MERNGVSQLAKSFIQSEIIFMRMPAFFNIIAMLTGSIILTNCTASSLMGFQADVPIRSFGNIVDDKQFGQLKVGMTKEQVAYIIGSPVLATPFEPQTWSYDLLVYDGDERIRLTSFSVIFDEDIRVEKWEFEHGDFFDLNTTGEFKRVIVKPDSDEDEQLIDEDEQQEQKVDDEDEHIKLPDA